MSWVAFFSQTGSEIARLSKNLGKPPVAIFTDNLDQSKWHHGIDHSSISVVSKKDRKDSNFFRRVLNTTDLVTLHGWLNIVPADICEEYNIYNGHPGLITEYPELKGKDPQQRCWENIHLYPSVGSVVHRVSPVVDDGIIISTAVVESSYCTSLDATFEILRYTSFQAWIKAFKLIQ